MKIRGRKKKTSNQGNITAGARSHSVRAREKRGSSNSIEMGQQ
jgi:hypothetical protein